MCRTTPWSSSDMDLLRDASRGLLQDQEAARAPEDRSCRVQCDASAAVVPTTSAVAEGVIVSTLDAHFACALHAIAPYARAVHEPT